MQDTVIEQSPITNVSVCAVQIFMVKTLTRTLPEVIPDALANQRSPRSACTPVWWSALFPNQWQYFLWKTSQTRPFQIRLNFTAFQYGWFAQFVLHRMSQQTITDKRSFPRRICKECIKFNWKSSLHWNYLGYSFEISFFWFLKKSAFLWHWQFCKYARIIYCPYRKTEKCKLFHV